MPTTLQKLHQWKKYEAEGDDYIPVDQWGKDHYSTLAYLETCAVDSHGKISNARMRCNPRLHREFVYVSPFAPSLSEKEYPTQLKNGAEKECHDDWSCLEDMVAAGLMTAQSRQVKSNEVFGNSEAKVLLTELGMKVAAKLRAHRANRGSYNSFVFC